MNTLGSSLRSKAGAVREKRTEVSVLMYKNTSAAIVALTSFSSPAFSVTPATRVRSTVSTRITRPGEV
jgi:hypothetical protein